VIVAALLPNALAGYFNLTYNHNRIADMNVVGLRDRFDTVQVVVNSIAFPLGILVGIWAIRRVAAMLDREKPTQSAQGGKHILFFGWFMSRLTLVEWSISGLIFPIAMNFGQRIDGIVGFYSHFFMSLALCGIAAAVFPYFLLTALAVRVYFPAIVRNGVVAGPRWHDLKKLRKLNLLHLALSAIVPMIGVLLASVAGTNQQWALIVVSSVGVVGFIVMFLLERYIEDNLDALEKIAVDTPRGM
jgi:hypothetical protein